MITPKNGTNRATATNRNQTNSVPPSEAANKSVEIYITEYRVVETGTVTDEELTRILNQETRAGWHFDTMTFVPNEASKRPRLAFVIFTRSVPSVASAAT